MNTSRHRRSLSGIKILDKTVANFQKNEFRACVIRSKSLDPVISLSKKNPCSTKLVSASAPEWKMRFLRSGRVRQNAAAELLAVFIQKVEFLLFGIAHLVEH